MISMREARKLGINRCVDLIGREFCNRYRKRSVSSFGRNGNIVDVFVGITDEERKPGKYKLSEKPFKYHALVYVDRLKGTVINGEFKSAK